jgi:NitT/TauT family transport system substrate-binding protein
VGILSPAGSRVRGVRLFRQVEIEADTIIKDMVMGKHPAWILLSLAIALLASDPSAAETPVKFLLDFRIQGPSAPFFVGIDKGYYKSAGLDVTIDAGSSASDTVSKLAAGAYDMALADINTLIRFRQQNAAAPIKAVFMVYNRPPFAIIARKSRGIAKPIDLEGKKLGAPVADTAFGEWPIFARANNIDTSKVTIENVGFPVREPMLAAGQVDAITGFSFNSYVDLKERGVPVDDLLVLMMADYGVNAYGDAIVINTQFAAAHPDAVKAFLRVFAKSLKETARDPSAAVDGVLKRNPDAKKDVELERLRMALRDNILTAEVKANGYGTIDIGRLQQSIEQMAQVYEFKLKPRIADIFDDSFLPAAADRKTN